MIKLPILLSLIYMVIAQWQRWSANQKYIYTGQLNIDCTNLPIESQYIATLPSAYINNETRIYISLLELNIPLNSLNLTLIPTVSERKASSFTVKIARNNTTTVLRLGISYMLIRWDDQLRKYDYNYLIVTQVDYSPPISNGSFSFYYPLDHPINQWSYRDTFCMLSGFSIINGSIPINVRFAIGSNVANEYTLWIYVNLYNNFTFTRISLVVVTFNRYGEYNKAITYSSGLYRQYSYSQMQLDSFTFNTFIGVNQIWSGLQFQVSVNNGSILASSGILYFKIFIFRPYYCRYPKPYYQPMSKQCLDACPDDQFFNDQNPYFLCKVKKITTTTIIGCFFTIILLLVGVYVIYKERKKRLRLKQEKKQQKQLKVVEDKSKEVDSSSIVQIGFVHRQNWAQGREIQS